MLYFKEKGYLSFCSGSDRISNTRIFAITLVVISPRSQWEKLKEDNFHHITWCNITRILKHCTIYLGLYCYLWRFMSSEVLCCVDWKIVTSIWKECNAIFLVKQSGSSRQYWRGLLDHEVGETADLETSTWCNNSRGLESLAKLLWGPQISHSIFLCLWKRKTAIDTIFTVLLYLTLKLLAAQ